MRVTCIIRDQGISAGKEYEVIAVLKEPGEPIYYLVKTDFYDGDSWYKESHFYISHRNIWERLLYKIQSIKSNMKERLL